MSEDLWPDQGFEELDGPHVWGGDGTTAGAGGGEAENWEPIMTPPASSQLCCSSVKSNVVQGSINNCPFN
jgi:hypothetical protein